MADAIQCDRCAEFTTAPVRAHIDFAPITGLIYGSMPSADLCERCRSALLDWVSDGLGRDERLDRTFDGDSDD